MSWRMMPCQTFLTCQERPSSVQVPIDPFADTSRGSWPVSATIAPLSCFQIPTPRSPEFRSSSSFGACRVRDDVEIQQRPSQPIKRAKLHSRVHICTYSGARRDPIDKNARSPSPSPRSAISNHLAPHKQPQRDLGKSDLSNFN